MAPLFDHIFTNFWTTFGVHFGAKKSMAGITRSHCRTQETNKTASKCETVAKIRFSPSRASKLIIRYYHKAALKRATVVQIGFHD